MTSIPLCAVALGLAENTEDAIDNAKAGASSHTPRFLNFLCPPLCRLLPKAANAITASLLDLPHDLVLRSTATRYRALNL